MRPARLLLLAAGLLAAAAHADQALVLTIAEYAGAPSLPGVRHDRDSALRIARSLGWPAGAVTEAADGALDHAGLHRQFAGLLERTQPGDRVFVYFSGHGTSRNAGGRCEQGLLAHDGQPFTAGEVARYLALLAGKAREVVMVVDACFAGGVAAGAALRGAAGPWQPKFARAQGEPGTDRCEQPSNFVPALTRPMRGAVNLERNHVVVAAARDDELAFDHAQRGGLATTALLQCLEGAAPPATIGELAVCAQAGVERDLPPDPRFRAQHITVAGNERLAVAAPAVAPTAAGRLAPVLERADPAWRVTLVANTNTLRIGRDELVLTATSARDGYLTLFHAGSDGRTLGTLYPAAGEAPRFVVAGTPFTLPRRWRARGPAGTNRIVAVVSALPMTLAQVLAGGGFGAAPLDVSEAD